MLEQQRNGPLSVDAQVDGINVYVQPDVLVHHLFAHLLRVLADERETGVRIGKCELDASPEDPIHAGNDIGRQRPARSFTRRSVPPA